MNEEIKVLIIEDNPADVRLITVYLEDFWGEKCSYVVSDYLAKGLDILSKEDFDIIILDLSLPDSRGLETFSKVYECRPEIPIIVLTGLEDDSVGINAMKMGAQDFLAKGNNNGKSLIRSINYSIERFKLLKELAVNSRKLEEKTRDLEHEQGKLANAQKLAHLGSWEWDIAENKIAWSDELYRIFGISKHVTIGGINDYLDLIHPADRKIAKEFIEESYNNQKPFNFHHRIVLPSKTVKIIHSIGEVTLNNIGMPVRMAGTAQDVTESFQKEELEKLVLAATQSYNSVIIFNKELKVEWVNEGFTRLTNYTLEDLKDKSISILRGNDTKGVNHQRSILASVIKYKKPVTYENINYTKQGKIYWVITTATPIVGKDGEVERIIAIESDITLRKKIEEELVNANKLTEQSLNEVNKTLEELIKAKKELEELMKVKEQFLANMSHEIRTPMNAIVGFTDLLLKTELNGEQRQFVDAVKNSGKTLLVIINDILDYSKIQSGKFVFEEIKFGVAKVISGAIKLMKPKADEKELKLSYVIDSSIPEQLIGDPIRLNQVILNLLGNAIRFTEVGEVKIETRLIETTIDAVKLSFAVSDTGIGIPKQKQSIIFEGFTQASSHTTRRYGGTGLGLTIAKQLVELQGGIIKVESEVDKGSTFTFLLSFRKTRSGDNKKSSSPVESENSFELLAESNILLVEDNKLNQILACKVLETWKCKVDIAVNGIVALEKLKEKDYDLILMDIQMPEMDGNEATQFIRTSFVSPKSETPIIAMTAHALAGEAEKCLNVGMNDYISKPFDTPLLYEKMLALIKGR